MNTKNNTWSIEYNFIIDFISFLRKERWYPEKSILSNYRNEWLVFDITIIEEKSNKISWIIETKKVEHIEKYKNNSKEFYDQIKKYYSFLEEGVNIYLVLFDKEWKKRYFLVVRHQLFEWDNFLEVTEFPTYRELTGSKLIKIKEEEKKDINANYIWFKRISWIFWGISILIFFLSLYKCELLYIKWNYIKDCSINLTYPNIILFLIWIILILIPFLRKIKTQWFEIDWEQENKGNK